MQKKQNLTGSRFGKLVVLKAASSILEGDRLKPCWNCLCDCGNVKIVKAYHLKSGGVISCGCAILRVNVGEKYGKLKALRYLGKSKWECLCDCDNIKIIDSYKLSSGSTKSCGCLKREVSKINIKKAIQSNVVYDPRISSARRVWQSYCRMDGYNSKNYILSFNDFYEISQMNCNYCDALPANNFNLMNYEYYSRADQSDTDGSFIYNGLDRIDNTKPHIKENCAPCCIICNRSKSNFTEEYFLNHVAKYRINESMSTLFNAIPCEKSLKSNISVIWKANYNEGNIPIEQFYSLSQLPCQYCGDLNTNKFFNFAYNGLDRIDSSMGHMMNNVVPCCKQCNFAKSNLPLKDFQSWMMQVQWFQKQKLMKATS